MGLPCHKPNTAANYGHSMDVAAKMLGTGRIRLFRELRQRHILDQNNVPFQTYIQRGYFKVMTGQWLHPEIGMQYYAKTLVTNRGIEWLKKELGLDNNAQKQEVHHG